MIEKNIKDLKYLSWTKTRESSGIAGSYLKSYSYSNGKKVYYKLSYFDDINGVFGYEAINEIIACRIMEQLNINHLDYHLAKAEVMINGKEYETYLNYSYDFKKPGESKITFEKYYEMNKEYKEDVKSFVNRMNFTNEIYQMHIIDFLINNRDRHGANIEILYDSKTKKYRLAPLFDQGLSLLSPNYLDKDINEFNPKEIKRANSFIGTSDLETNLKTVPVDFLPKNLDIDSLFIDLDFVNPLYLKKCRELISDRWCRLENIRNKK